jgi:hypothetical protein
MPVENRFFRFIWRVDAVLLALAGLLVVGLVTSFLVQDWMRPTNLTQRDISHLCPRARSKTILIG